MSAGRAERPPESDFGATLENGDEPDVAAPRPIQLEAADYNTAAVMVFFLASAAEKVNAEAVVVLALILAFIGGLLVARKNA